MITINNKANKKKQNGIALLVLVITIALTISAYYFSSISVVDIENENKQKTQLALKKAKKALLDYAVANWGSVGEGGKLGKLPCPDYIAASTTEGEQDGSCAGAYANAIGFFPWRTLGMDVPKDGAGNCLIYIVSPAYKTSPLAALNPDSYGQLRTVDALGNDLQGANPEGRLVAVIIAPGKPLPGQIRNFAPDTICGAEYGNIAAYLDANNNLLNTKAVNYTNTDGDIDSFVHSYPGSEQAASPLNDRLITISYSELWDALEGTITSTAFNDRMENLTEALAMCLAEYAKSNIINANKKSLPWPAAINLNGNEYRNNYSYDDNIDGSKGHSGRLPYQVLNSNATIGNALTQPPTPYAGFFEYGICSSLYVTDGTTIDLTDKNGEYWNLWSNWKDHFFYAVSKAYNPDNTSMSPSCSMTTPCISSNAKEYAGMVFFSGLKQDSQQRYSPPLDGALALDDVDDKDDVVNYLENSRAANFPDNTGDKSYAHVESDSNDIMFCIDTDADMTVEVCP